MTAAVGIDDVRSAFAFYETRLIRLERGAAARRVADLRRRGRHISTMVSCRLKRLPKRGRPADGSAGRASCASTDGLLVSLAVQRMALYRKLEQAKFEPRDVATLSEAYELTLHQLRLTDRTHPITELLAAKVIQVFRLGEHDPRIIARRAIAELGARPFSEN